MREFYKTSKYLKTKKTLLFVYNRGKHQNLKEKSFFFLFDNIMIGNALNVYELFINRLKANEFYGTFMLSNFYGKKTLI